jgi:hypothetical protein
LGDFANRATQQPSNLWPARREDNVCRLEIAMHDALGMGRGEGIRQGEADVEERRHLEPAARNALVQRFAFQQFHDEERHR